MKNIIIAALLTIPGALEVASGGTIVIDEQRGRISQPDSILLKLTGASSLEELDETEVERYEHLASHPISINTASRSRLLACGLFSSFQVASMLDYQEHQGDILSFSELSRVDGFTREFIEIIKPFIQLDFTKAGGQSSRYSRKSFEMVTTATGKGSAGSKENIFGESGTLSGTAAGKIKYVSEGRFSISATYRDTPSANITIYGHRKSGKLASRNSGIKECEPTSNDSEIKHNEPAGSNPEINKGKSTGGNPENNRRNPARSNSRFRLGKIVAGDFGARFGQGLAIWSGFSLSGLSSIQAFYKRATGISPSWTYSTESVFRGAAADFEIGSHTLTALASIKSGEEGGALNVNYLGKKGEAGITAAFNRKDGLKAGADFRRSIKGTDLFGEAVFNGQDTSVSSLLGTVVNIDYTTKLAFRINATAGMAQAAGSKSIAAVSKQGSVARNSIAASGPVIAAASASGSGPVIAAASASGSGPVIAAANTAGSRIEVITGTAEAAAGMQIKEHFLSIEEICKLDNNSHTIKLLEQSAFHLSEHLTFNVRLSEKFKSADSPTLRHDLRGDFIYSLGPWNAGVRLNGVYGVNTAGLMYAECGYKSENAAIWLRGTAFHIDNWDDRIYCYERDAPGAFNVPAYYGRGFKMSLTGSLKYRSSRFDLRISYLSSSRNEKLEIKIQYRLNL